MYNRVLAPTSTNDANYNYTDPTNLLTPVGTFADSPGPYGTYDMGGDVIQGNVADISGSFRGVRGGTCAGTSDYVASSFRYDSMYPWTESPFVGFRVASIAVVPEPSTLILLSVGAIKLLGYTWRRRR